MAGKLFSYKSQAGRPVQNGDIQITPIAWAFRLQAGKHVGFIWNRPSAIAVEAAGSRRLVPVTDVTRLIIWAIWGTAFSITLIAWLARRSGRSLQTKQGE